MPAVPRVSRLDRYIFRQLLVGLVAVTLGLTALIWLTQSLRFVRLVVDHGLSFGVFLVLTGLLVPSFIAVVLPITTFVVIQFVYQRLAGDREITVMRAAGRSDLALARPALALALLATLAGYGLNLWAVPASFRAFAGYRWQISHQLAAFLVQDGVFTRLAHGLTVYIQRRDRDGTLHGILIDDARNPRAAATVIARSGQMLQTRAGPAILLRDGTRQAIDPRTGRLNVLSFRRNVLDLTERGGTPAARVPGMVEVSLWRLLHPPAFVAASDRPRWVAEANKRLSSPLATLTYAAIALLSVLTGTFRRHGSYLRPLAAVAAVVGLIALQLSFGDLAARNNGLIVLIWLEAVLPAAIAFGLLLGPELLAPARLPVPQ
ncbi:MAG: LPS export ABC transporter permease LptF [Acetobacteraceae bacterium]